MNSEFATRIARIYARKYKAEGADAAEDYITRVTKGDGEVRKTIKRALARLMTGRS